MSIGAILGVVVGAISGAGAATISILLPTNFSMDPLDGMTLLLGVYCGAACGAAIPAVMINTPGSPVSVLTALEAKPFVMRGEARRAMSLAYSSSFVGGVLALMLLTQPLANVAKDFGSPEFAMLAMAALVLVIIGHQGRRVEALGALAFGLFLATVGGGNRLCYPAIQLWLSTADLRHPAGAHGDRAFRNVRGVGSADQQRPTHDAGATERALLSGLHGGLQVSKGAVWVIFVRHFMRHHAGRGRVFGTAGELCGGQEIFP